MSAPSGVLTPPSTACVSPGCRNIVPYGQGDRCKECKRERNRRFDTAEWERTRQRILTRDPLCTWREEQCFEPSSHVDHVVPWEISHDDSDENLQGLCPSHHNVKTRREQALQRLSVRGRRR